MIKKIINKIKESDTNIIVYIGMLGIVIAYILLLITGK